MSPVLAMGILRMPQPRHICNRDGGANASCPRKARLAQAYYDLAVMLDAGVPILRSLDIMIQGRTGHLKQVFSRIRESLSKGSSLAEAMGKHRNVFPDMDRMLIEAAETAGSLNDSFKMLSQWHEFICRITRRIQMGLIYPLAHPSHRGPGLRTPQPHPGKHDDVGTISGRRAAS